MVCRTCEDELAHRGGEAREEGVKGLYETYRESVDESFLQMTMLHRHRPTMLLLGEEGDGREDVHNCQPAHSMRIAARRRRPGTP